MKITCPHWFNVSVKTNENILAYLDREKIIIRNTAQQYSVVTPDVDHAVLIAIEQDQPNNAQPPPPPPHRPFRFALMVHAA